MRPEFAKLMTHTITIMKIDKNFTGDLSVTETHTDIQAFVEYGKRQYVDKTGATVMAKAIVYLRDDAPVNPEHPTWKIAQTAPYVRPEMTVMDIFPIDDPRDGLTHHYECYVQ